MLVKDVKRKTQLSETTILRVIDMTFALAQQNRAPSFDFPPDEAVEDAVEDNVIEFPTPAPTEEN